MRRSGSKSLLRRVIEKVIPNAIGRNPPECPVINISKAIGNPLPDTAPQAAKTRHHASYTVTSKSQPDPSCGFQERQSYHSDTHIKPPQRRSRANTLLSIQTQKSSADGRIESTGRQTTRLNLDNFIQRIESWTPPSPREILARRLLREVQRATNTHREIATNQPLAGGYLVHRRIKSETV
ncbi:hypothetical protein OPQ81_004046 [Rhizoctonia solani]|nr:hypothetical protein OPQ81_004046 [Rhizoctonia solani]